MEQAKKGDKVKVNYSGRLNDGTVFDNTEAHGEALEFVIGEGGLIPGFENAVDGMAPGETRTVTIASDEAFGAYDEELLLEVPRDQFPEGFELEMDQELELEQEDGETAIVRIAGLSEESVTLDANHPLAGQDLTFEITLLEILQDERNQNPGG